VAEQARIDHFAFTITRHDLEPLAERIWQLRHQLTTYDASYIALAEALSAPLYTCDAKLAGGSHGAQVEVIARTH
jgi:predicted nucleic acid-binding protein